MQVVFQMEGGVARFPGLARPITLSDDDLTSSEINELRDLTAAARFFQAPEADPSGPAGPDAQRYSLSIADGTHLHTVRRHDPVGPPALADLLTYVRRKAMSVLRARAKPPSP